MSQDPDRGGESLSRLLDEALRQPPEVLPLPAEANEAVSERLGFLEMFAHGGTQLAAIYAEAAELTRQEHARCEAVLALIQAAAPILKWGEPDLLSLAGTRLASDDQARVAAGRMSAAMAERLKEIRLHAEAALLAEDNGDGGAALTAFLAGLEDTDPVDAIGGRMGVVTLRVGRDAARMDWYMAYRSMLVSLVMRSAFHLVVTIEGDRLRREVQGEHLLEFSRKTALSMAMTMVGIESVMEVVNLVRDWRNAQFGAEQAIRQRIAEARVMEEFGVAYIGVIDRWMGHAAPHFADLSNSLARLLTPAPAVPVEPPPVASRVWQPRTDWTPRDS